MRFETYRIVIDGNQLIALLSIQTVLSGRATRDEERRS